MRPSASIETGLAARLRALGWTGWILIALITSMALVGVATLYSAADMSWSPWAARHGGRFLLFALTAMTLAFTPLSIWRAAAYPAYLAALVLLVGVELVGEMGKGAQRWIDIGPARIQPSEIMKIALVLALARYYHDLPLHRVSNVLWLIPPLVMIAAPAVLIVRQPDLGTALLVAATGGAIIFLAGLQWRWIVWGGLAAVAGVAILFTYGLHEYQRARIMTFLDPEADPMGSGYHILQSIIAIGSGGLQGKGFGAGTQTQLDFLPEKHTDFIFTVIGEEFGFFGGAGVLLLAAAVIATSGWIAAQCRSQFGRLAALGVCVTFALYVAINVGMVMGLLPVVGVPLPLVSYGGTVMLAVMCGFGLVLSARVYRDSDLPRTF